MGLPVRIGRLDRLGRHPLARPRDHLVATQIEDEKRLRVRRGRAVPASTRELEVRTGSGNLEENPVVPLVILEARDLGETEAVPVEAHDLVEAVGVPGDAKLHGRLARLAYAREAV